MIWIDTFLYLVWVEVWKTVWFFLMLSLDSYPRIAGDSHILFQPITAISSLLDLIGPLPQGRRLFGPTVLESRQPSRNLPIFSGRNFILTGRKANELPSEIFNFQFWNSSRRLEENCKSENHAEKKSWFLFLIYFYFILRFNFITFQFDVIRSY